MKKIGCCIKAKDIDAALKYQLDYIELPLAEITLDNNYEHIISKIINNNVPCYAVTKLLNNSIHISSDFSSEDIQKYLIKAFSTMNKIGAKIAVFGNSKSRIMMNSTSAEVHEENMIDFCKKLAEMAQQYDVTIGLEPLNSKQCNYINTLDDAAYIVKKVNRSNFRIVADYYHMFQQNEPLTKINEYSELICHVHTADIITRDYPGYDEKQVALLSILTEVGYNGSISIETNNISPNKKIDSYVENVDQLLLCTHLNKTYGKTKVLSDVNLTVQKGEIRSIVGANGSGKSTLIKIISGVIQPDNEKCINFNNKELSNNSIIRALGEGISVVHQDFSLLPNLTVMENLSITKHIKNHKQIVNYTSLQQEAKNAMKTIGLDIDCNCKVSNLSTSIKQLIAIARALTLEAKLIILDEPTSTLTDVEINVLFTALQKLKENGVSILFISHKIEEVLKISDRVSILRDGKMIGTYNNYNLSKDFIVEKMVQKNVSYTRIANPAPKNEVVLCVEHLGKKGIFRDVNFHIKKGEIVAFSGLIGSGRTELMQAIYGLTSFDEGTIYFNNKKVSFSSSEKSRKAGLSFVPENRREQGLLVDKSLKENITIRVLKNLKNKVGLITNSVINNKAKDLASKYNVEPLEIDYTINKFSGGNQQKILLARSISDEPELLIIDEPTNGIDIGAREEIHKELVYLAQKGVAILIISSYIDEILTLSNRIYVMKDGMIQTELDASKTTYSELSEIILTKEQDSEENKI